MLSTVAVLRHLAFEDLGIFAPILEAKGLSVKIYDVGVDDIAEPINSADLVILLGGPIGAYEVERYPFLAEEQALLSRRLDRHLPTLGICLGAQLIAAAAGAHVYKGGTKEIGWGTLQLTADGKNSCLTALQDVAVLHWHGDTFDLPEGAQLLASNENYPHQAFSLGNHILGMQFHPEIDPARIEQWLIGHSVELDHAGIDTATLRRTTEMVRDRVKPAAQRLLTEWLDQLAG